MTLPDDWRHDREIGVQQSTTLDTTRVDDVRIGAVRPLISPALLLDDMPAPDSAVTLVEKARVELAKVLAGSDDRLIVVVGPCSIHDHDQALEYARHLKVVADAL